MNINKEQNIAPIAVYDSGIGGLSIAQKINKLLPAERILYLADSADGHYSKLVCF